jgi:Asp-tRNA(Asn)/Glu-tRNA(Gln) amidotransferase A subunit family amidase
MVDIPVLGDVEETVLKAKAALESMGHTLIQFEISGGKAASDVAVKLLNGDQGKQLLEALKHDRVSPLMERAYRTARTPLWKRKLLTSIPFLKSHYAYFRPGLETIYTSDFWDVMGERDAIRDELLDRMQALDLDLILCPVFPFPAVGVDDIVNLGLGTPKIIGYNGC